MLTRLLLLVLVLTLAQFNILNIECKADSASIRQAIIDELEQHSDLGKHEITIAVRQDVVILTGQVASEYDSELVERVANSTDGVKQVKNYLGVSTIGLGDTNAIAREISERVSTDGTIGRYQLKVAMTGSTAKLTGEVSSAEDLKKIETIARSTPGVGAVHNGLALAALPSDQEIASRVRNALANEGGIIVDDLIINAKDGVVTITGTRENHKEVDRILSVALMVDGVRDIRSDMTIEHDTYRARMKSEFH